MFRASNSLPNLAPRPGDGRGDKRGAQSFFQNLHVRQPGCVRAFERFYDSILPYCMAMLSLLLPCRCGLGTRSVERDGLGDRLDVGLGRGASH